MSFSHVDLLVVFKWLPSAAIPDYALPVREAGKYVPLLSTDEERFGGPGRIAMNSEHFSFPVAEAEADRPHIRIYNPSRAATAYLRRE